MMIKLRMKWSGAMLGALIVLCAGVQANAATLTVTSLADSGAGSLRDQVAAAAVGDTINFSLTGTITLTSGEIVIGQNLAITGPAAPGITVSGNNVSRIFFIAGGTVTLSSLTLSGGNGAGSANDGYGGAINNGGTLTVTSGTVSGNGALYGAAIFNTGTVNISNSTFSGNTASQAGGAIFNQGGVTVTNSTLSGNTASFGGGAIFNTIIGAVNLSNSTLSGNGSPGNGGAIFNYNAVTVTNSTLFSNNSGNSGAGIYNYQTASLTVTNSTLSGNISSSDGGAIYNGGTLTMTSSTLSGNNSDAHGGGIFNGGAVNLSNSIVAANIATSGGPDIFGGITSGDYNLVQNTNGEELPGSHNITGQGPQLAALANNGGPTLTMALLSNSEAVNGGDPSFDTTATPFDQRGGGFARKVSSAVDIGAFESAFTLRVPLATAVSFTALPNSAFTGQLTANVWNPGDTLTYAILTGTLPAGLAFDAATGIISGTTTGPSHSTLTFKATDNHGNDSNTATATIDFLEAPSLIVTTTSDDSTNSDGVTSLREAVAYASSGNAGAAPVVTFANGVTGTIALTQGGIGIAHDLTITGPGAGSLTVSRSPSYGYSAPVFSISSGIFGLSGLTLSHGSGIQIGNLEFGGAIYMTGGTVTITSSTLSNNIAYDGGAIYMTGGSLAVTGSTLSNNSANSGAGYGGAINVAGGSLTVTSSTISGNLANYGGGIYNSGGTVFITSSTISGNTTSNATNGFGAGIFNSGGQMTITNSTISGNHSQAFSGNYFTANGGGIHNNSALTIANSTITGNVAESGGGIWSDGTLNLSNSIVAGNSNYVGDPGYVGGPDIGGTVTSGDYNLVQGISSFTTLSGTHNITGQAAVLGALSNNGGPTLTEALLLGSPATDAGDPNFDATNMPYDQRGPGFPRVKNGRVCIGAFESELNQSGNSLIVGTLADHDYGFCGVTDCSLREAVKYAPAGATITFSVTGTITLTSGDIAIAKSLTITGPASSPGITVSGNNASRIFTSSIGTVNLSTLTLIGGNGVSSANNGFGGAINVVNGVVTVTKSTFSGNSGVNGGALRNAGTLTVTNSSFSGNTASSGGAIRSGTTLTITNSTFSGNTASTNGGGIYIVSGAVNLSNSIVAGNSAPSSPDIFGTVASGDYDLVQDTSGATLPGTHNVTGQPALLAALANNGGPTQTLALLAGSPALDAGDPSFDTTNMPYDQRGSGYARKGGSAIDIGAFELQPATHFNIAAPPSALLGSQFSISVVALDQHENAVAVYGGTIHFTSSDASAALPPDSPLGSGTFSATLNTAGSQTITATATMSPMITGTSNAIGVCTFTLLPASMTAPAGGLSGSFNDTSGSACGWVALSNAAWLTTTSSGTGNGSVSYTVAPNPSTLPRIGSILVGDQTFTMTQSGVAPTNLVAATDGGSASITLTWNSVGVDHYEIWRNAGSGYVLLTTGGTFNGTGGWSFVDSGISANAAYAYEVRAVDSGANQSDFSNRDLATTFVFTDDPLAAGVTAIKAVHITQLQNAVTVVRTLAGVGSPSFTHTSPAGLPVTAADIQELRDALDGALSALQIALPAYSPIGAGDSVIAAAITEIRATMK